MASKQGQNDFMCTCLRHNGANLKFGVKEGKGVFLIRVFPKYFVVVTSETKAISIVNRCNCCWLLHIRLGWSCMWKAIQ